MKTTSEGREDSVASILAELKRRVITGLILVPLFLLILYEGRISLIILILLMLTVAMREFIELSRKFAGDLPSYLGYTILFLVLFFFFFHSGELSTVFIVALTLFLIFLPLNYARGYSLTSSAILFFAGLYLGVGGGSVYLIRREGFSTALAFFVTIWVFDTAAYIGGKLAGRRKLLKEVSPGKSLEGVLIGLIVSLPLALLYKKFLIHPFEFLPDAFFYVALICLLSQIGDLAESAIKREANVKDSSNIFPGHGGALDRIDSVLLSAPIYYVLMKIT